MLRRRAQIATNDFDEFVSEVAAEVWNKIVHKPAFDKLQPTNFAELFDAVNDALVPYRKAGPRSRGRLAN
jgi:hypothetical protein